MGSRPKLASETIHSEGRKRIYRGGVCVVTVQGRWKLPRGGVVIVRGMRGRAAADSVSAQSAENFYDYSAQLPRNCFRSVSLH